MRWAQRISHDSDKMRKHPKGASKRERPQDAHRAYVMDWP